MRPCLATVAITILAIISGCASQHASPTPWYTTIPIRASTQPATADPEARDIVSQTFPRPLRRENAFVILLSTNEFFGIGLGLNAGDTPSTQVEAFRVLYEQPDAVAAFGELLTRGTLAGQLYALCGLRLLSPQAYAAAEPRYIHMDQEVSCGMHGCTVEPEKVSELITAPPPDTRGMDADEADWQRKLDVPFDLSSGELPLDFIGWGDDPPARVDPPFIMVERRFRLGDQIAATASANPAPAGLSWFNRLGSADRKVVVVSLDHVTAIVRDYVLPERSATKNSHFRFATSGVSRITLASDGQFGPLLSRTLDALITRADVRPSSTGDEEKINHGIVRWRVDDPTPLTNPQSLGVGADIELTWPLSANPATHSAR